MFLFRSLCRLKALWKVPYQQRLELIVRRVDWVPGRRIDSFDISDISIKEFRYKFKRTGNTCQNQLKTKDDDILSNFILSHPTFPKKSWFSSWFIIWVHPAWWRAALHHLWWVHLVSTIVPFFNVVKGNERLLNLWNVTYMWAEMWLTCDLLWSV